MNFKDDIVLQCQKVGQVYQKNVCDSARIESYILVEQCLSLWHSLCGRGGTESLYLVQWKRWRIRDLEERSLCFSSRL